MQIQTLLSTTSLSLFLIVRSSLYLVVSHCQILIVPRSFSLSDPHCTSLFLIVRSSLYLVVPHCQILIIPRCFSLSDPHYTSLFLIVRSSLYLVVSHCRILIVPRCFSLSDPHSTCDLPGSCSHTCVTTDDGAYCTCPIGYQLQNDGLRCTDYDECRYISNIIWIV